MRATRLSKLEETKNKLNNDKKEPPSTNREARFSKRTQERIKAPTVTTTSANETVSSLASAEKKENKDSCAKMAGMGFNFKMKFQRETMNRADLTKFVQGKYDELES